MINDKIILHKGTGKFYYVYNDDAIILSYLFDYKILDNKRCGFPDNALNKVLNTLENKKISYEIFKYDKTHIVKNYKNLNTYNSILKEAISYLDNKNRIDLLIAKIKEFPPEKIDNLIKVLEECLL